MALDKRASADIVLDFPINFDGETITKLTMRRPKVKDSKWAAAQGSDDEAKGEAMMARLCGVQVEALEEMDLADMDKLQKQFLSFRGMEA